MTELLRRPEMGCDGAAAEIGEEEVLIGDFEAGDFFV